MVQGLIGKKLGMTQIFDEQGNAVPVTVIQAGPCVVVQRKTRERDGYEAVQLGFVEPGRKYRANKPQEGHFKKAGIPPTAVLKEFGLAEQEGSEPAQVGGQVMVGDVFEIDDEVNVVGRVKGRGFQGVVRRHGFRGGRATHGSMFHRAPGSIGASAYPSRVLPGMRAAGRMGNNQMTVRRLTVVQVDPEKNLLLVKGSVPGTRNGYVCIMKARG
jgi:large subunit ribosomal protein L3